MSTGFKHCCNYQALSFHSGAASKKIKKQKSEVKYESFIFERLFRQVFHIFIGFLNKSSCLTKGQEVYVINYGKIAAQYEELTKFKLENNKIHLLVNAVRRKRTRFGYGRLRQDTNHEYKFENTVTHFITFSFILREEKISNYNFDNPNMKLQKLIQSEISQSDAAPSFPGILQCPQRVFRLLSIFLSGTQLSILCPHHFLENFLRLLDFR